MSNTYDDALVWLAMERYELVDGGIYTKDSHDEDLLGVQVMKDVKTQTLLVRFTTSANGWTDLPFIECQSLIQFIAIVKNFERMDSEILQSEESFHKAINQRNALQTQLDELRGGMGVAA